MIERLQTTFYHWLRGIRFYIACLIGLVTLEAWWWASAGYSGSVLFATRLEEVYAWLSLGLLSLALLIGPLYSVFPRIPGNSLMRDARRMIGIGAGWFATLHVTIVYTSLFKWANPLYLPTTYQQSFLYGSGALVILLAMVFTSFDKAFNTMGKWWFRLHRLVYVGALLTLLHAFTIGTHATQWLSLIVLTATALLILILHTYLAFVRHQKPTIWQVLAIGYGTLLLIAVFNFGYGQKLGFNPIEGKYGHHEKV